MVSAVDPRGDRLLCVVLHDVAPERWAGCTRVLRELRWVAEQSRTDLPLTLLVVPHMHAASAGDALPVPAATPTPPHYLGWLRRQSRVGHELALHGLTHLDSGAGAPSATHRRRGWLRSAIDHARRRWYTAGEGEFAALDRDSAAQRIAAGRQWAAAHQLDMRGFVAPAWLLSAGAWDAVEDAGFDYTCTLTRLFALPGRRSLAAPAIVFSTRSAWRRIASLAWNLWRGRSGQRAAVLRLDLHPSDANHPWVLRCWTWLLARALRERQAVTLAAAVQRLLSPATSPAAQAA